MDTKRKVFTTKIENSPKRVSANNREEQQVLKFKIRLNLRKSSYERENAIIMSKNRFFEEARRTRGSAYVECTRGEIYRKMSNE